MALAKIGKEGLPKKLQGFLEGEERLYCFPVKVEAPNSPYLGRIINFYPVATIELLLRVYSSAFLAGVLQKNQLHIGQKCLQLQSDLVVSGLDSLIWASCGVNPKMQEAVAQAFRKSSFDEEREILARAIQFRYPQLTARKRQALLAQAFKYGYADALTPEEQQRIKRKESPLHQHLEEPKPRQRFSHFLLLLAGTLILEEAELVRAREKARTRLHKLGELQKAEELRRAELPNEATISQE